MKINITLFLILACLCFEVGETYADDYAVAIDPNNNVSCSGVGNFSGNYKKMTDGSGMNGNGDIGPAGWPTNLPSLWTATSSQYQAEWQCTGGSSGLLTGADNGKIGWITFDLGESLTLADMYFWNSRDGTGSAGIQGFNLYFADNALNIPSPAKVDYLFSSGNGWTQYNDDDANPATPRYTMLIEQADGSCSLTMNLADVNARYIGIEVLTNYGNTGRIGLAEFGITATPPPAGTVFTIR